MDLPAFIRSVGDAAAVEILDAPLRTIKSWKYREKTPRAKKALEIERRTKGKVRFAEIYAGGR